MKHVGLWICTLLIALSLSAQAQTEKTYYNGYCCTFTDWSDCYPNMATPQECSDAGRPPGSLECPHAPWTHCTGATASNSNASVVGGGTTYPPPFSDCYAGYWAGALNYTERSVNAKHYAISDSLNEWVVSAPPGMVPVQAKVKFYVFAAKNTDGRALVADWHTYSPVCRATDYSATAIDTAMAAVPLSGLKKGWNTVELRNVSNIPANGRIGLRFHIDGGEPTGTNMVALTNGRGSGLGPSLAVSYAGSGASSSGTSADALLDELCKRWMSR